MTHRLLPDHALLQLSGCDLLSFATAWGTQLANPNDEA